MKIAHEAPIPLFDEVQRQTNYDYCLVHLMDEQPQYVTKFMEAKEKGREIILDNSIFELGEAYEKSKYIRWINELKPNWFIIPDVLEDATKTVENVKEWKKLHLPGKKIGVVQGKTISEMLWCYMQIAPLVDKIAISFDYSVFINETAFGKLPTKFHHYMYGRDAFLHTLKRMKILREDKPHHLLGIGLPQEITAYRDYHWIDSIDTSNPVVAGIEGLIYNGINGLERKPDRKLFTMINYDPTESQKDIINYNIRYFRYMIRGTG